jgi:uncharacterized Zn finger protein
MRRSARDTEPGEVNTMPKTERPSRRAGTPRFDPQALRELAGDGAYARGVEYVRAGRVELLSGGADRVLARVLGSEVYRVELGGRDAELSGHCSCPAFERGFCKHMVATALAVDAETGAGREVPDRIGAIRAHLRGQGVDRLADMILGLAERDQALLDRLDLAAGAATSDPEELAERCRKALRRALRTGGFVEYGGAGRWVEGVLAVLEQMETLVAAGHAVPVLGLLDDAFPRIARALEQVDDSDGGGIEILERAAAVHLAACRAARPEPVALARDLFARETEGEFDIFHGAGTTYAELLGPEGLAEYRRLAQAAWERLRPGRRMVGRVMVMDADGIARHRLSGILDGFAARDGDLETRIALRAGDLVRAHDYLRLAEFCLEHDRSGEALRWAEEGAWLFDEDPSAERLLLFLAARYRAVGCAPEAEAALWRGFERRPSMELYRGMAETAPDDAAGRTALADRAVALLEQRLAVPKGTTQDLARGGLADLLVEVLVLERRLPEAWAASRRHGCSAHRLLHLAEASETTCPEDALGAYAELAERQIALANRGGYTEACRLIARMGALRAAAGEEAAHRAYVADLLSRHEAKRSFAAMLAEVAGSGGHGPGQRTAGRSGSNKAWQRSR